MIHRFIEHAEGYQYKKYDRCQPSADITVSQQCVTDTIKDMTCWECSMQINIARVDQRSDSSLSAIQHSSTWVKCVAKGMYTYGSL